MSAYDEARKASHLTQQAIARFGRWSAEADRVRAVSGYWHRKWKADGGSVISPPADILLERIKDAERSVKRDEKRRSGS